VVASQTKGFARPLLIGAYRGVRRIHLPATRHHIYYLVGKEAVIVLAVWGSVKRSGPDLKGIE